LLKFSGVLIGQLLLLAAALIALGEFAVNFPYPSPLIKPLLPPHLRWPTGQVMGWIETQTIDPAFQRFFYRDPDRVVPGGASLVAPADGLVQKSEFRGGVTYLVIGLSFWDVHVVRTPVAGIVKSVATDGEYYARFPTKAEADASFFLRGKAAPVQQIVTLQTTMGEVRVRLITSYWASRIKVWAHPGQHLEKGQRIGRILLGSTVVGEFPGRIDFAVKPMQHVAGGETVIGTVRPDR